jgi:hypothetical protein
MFANPQSIADIFVSPAQYIIPVFQRYYVWDLDRPWQGLSEDLGWRHRNGVWGSFVADELELEKHTPPELAEIADQTTVIRFIVATRQLLRRHMDDFDHRDDLIRRLQHEIRNRSGQRSLGTQGVRSVMAIELRKRGVSICLYEKKRHRRHYSERN